MTGACELWPGTQQLQRALRVGAVGAGALQQRAQLGVLPCRCRQPAVAEIEVHAQHRLAAGREPAKTPQRPQADSARRHQTALGVGGRSKSGSGRDGVMPFAWLVFVSGSWFSSHSSSSQTGGRVWRSPPASRARVSGVGAIVIGSWLAFARVQDRNLDHALAAQWPRPRPRRTAPRPTNVPRDPAKSCGADSCRCWDGGCSRGLGLIATRRSVELNTYIDRHHPGVAVGGDRNRGLRGTPCRARGPGRHRPKRSTRGSSGTAS